MDCKNSNILYERESKYDRKKLDRKEKKVPSRTSTYDFFSHISHIYIYDLLSLSILISSLVSGLIPRHKKNDSAACSTSIPAPSDRYPAPSF